MNNVEEAREAVRKLKSEVYRVKSKSGWDTSVRNKQEVVISKIRSFIVSHERGNNVYETHLELGSMTDIENVPEESSDRNRGEKSERDEAYIRDQMNKPPWKRDANWREKGGYSTSERDKFPWQREKGWRDK
ncbi:hypothetical protein [endosymbiont GvMRE of Glomus versiforme]|uniref:hypothetical protein n=1 Tax=endosymbiont GvMRE of Glomus versiforme TaxID=2039283 RepID=UPI000EE12454|nr:hypothetical protein [endosymbiont GvMRE of Glomus versiforme]RHZ36030.1 hypothetical protein GvMRE_Ic3g16 [endosymbiont GvMRE of Glomus versiforme]